MDILLPQAVLVAVLYIVPAGIDHKNAGALRSILFIYHQDTGRNPCAIEQVGGQANQSLDIPPIYNSFADVRFCIAAKQHTMGQNDCGLAIRFQRFQNMKQPSIVAVLLRRHP